MKKGFTLIELSIVLVIIALIAGGILIGNDLINAAKTQKLITVHGRLSTSINTFKAKYGYVPGDLLKPRAEQFGFATCSSFNFCGNGDGRINAGLIFAHDPYYLGLNMVGETTLFWKQLAQASLFESSVESNAPIDINATPTPSPATEADVWRYVPKGPQSGALFISNIFPNNGTRIGLTFAKASTIPGAFPIPTASVLTPLQALHIDQKMDDGVPIKGNVFSYCNPADPLAETTAKASICAAASPNLPNCHYNSGYNITGSQANSVNCELNIAIPAINP